MIQKEGWREGGEGGREEGWELRISSKREGWRSGREQGEREIEDS